MAAAPAWGTEVSLSVRIGAAGERRPPGASGACHLTPSCFETRVRATDEQHLLRPAFETIAKRPENFLLWTTSKQNSVPSVTRLRPRLCFKARCRYPSVSSALFPCTPVPFSTVYVAGSIHIAAAACVLRWTRTFIHDFQWFIQRLYI
jgi:hypothetical protein